MSNRHVGPLLVGVGIVGVDLGLTLWYKATAPRLVVNPGIAFGLLSHDPRGVLVTVSVGLLGAWILYGQFRSRWPVHYPGAFVFGGAFANLLSRVEYGGVVDYWHVTFYPFWFNLADIALRVGVLWIVLMLWTNRPKTWHPPAKP